MTKLAHMLAVSSAVITISAHADVFDDFIANVAEINKDADESDSSILSLDAKKGMVKNKDASKPFYLLPCCKYVEGKAEICIPGSKGWTALEEGRYYPLGSTFRTVGAGSSLRIAFGFESEVSISDDSSFGTVIVPAGEQKRAITLINGVVNVKVPNNLKEGLFTVNTPGFVAYNPAGESRYTYAKTVDGYDATVRCVTKTLSLKGRNFDIQAMRAANELRIKSSHDFLFTSLYGVSGDILVCLDQGRVINKDYGTGETKHEDKTLDWKLSPFTSVRIHRAKPLMATDWSVSVMTFDTRGNLKNRCAFAEKTVEMNLGEMGPTSKKEREALMKRVSDLSTTEVDAVEAEATTEEVSDANESDSE